MNALSARGAASSALLDPAESVLKARPLRSWEAAQKEAVRVLFAGLHRDWSAEWVPVRETVSMLADVEVVEPEGTLVLAGDEVASWSFAEAPRRAGASLPDSLPRSARDASQAALQALADRMFAFDLATSATAPVAPAVAPAVVRAAWADWLQRLGKLLGGFALQMQPPKGAPGTSVPSDPWSGVLCVRWNWCGGVWSLGLPHAVVTALLGSQATKKAVPAAPAQRLPKARLDQALAGERVALRVMLDGVELNLGQLQELRLDDVIPLQHLLDAPALVIGTDGTPVCRGWLGQSDGRIAIELAVQATPNPNTHPLKEKTP
ncbi:FliM/FliN family flagellar motor switch protein [Variovorax sp. 770b2]|uniref:FliM/FliN family flagellar motor switch protein n=1 Tax=Variovorax sp. 770b2 TaxID=1566271 RepID=UPI0008DEFEE0|nr:FliM/FliN family flagellar motor C-terminal domain-containing protein [Variovorax sp. 770b2]SFQ11175.1 Type III flagellar switch regulator (C-ring) FliN C-term [Variovorax sp. 770b2]